MLTWLIGGKSTGALSAGHISSNQQDDASRLRLLLIQSCRRITALVSHYMDMKSVRLKDFDPCFSLFRIAAVGCYYCCFFQLDLILHDKAHYEVLHKQSFNICNSVIFTVNTRREVEQRNVEMKDSFPANSPLTIHFCF